MKRIAMLLILMLMVALVITPIASAACNGWSGVSFGTPYCGGPKCGPLWLRPSERRQSVKQKRNCPTTNPATGAVTNNWEYRTIVQKIGCC